MQFLVQQEYIFYCIPYRSQKQKFCSLFALKILIMKKASISKPARRIVSNAGYISCSFNNDYGNDKNNMKCCHQFGTKYTIPPKNFSEVVQGRAMYLRLFAKSSPRSAAALPNTSALHIFVRRPVHYNMISDCTTRKSLRPH